MSIFAPSNIPYLTAMRPRKTNKIRRSILEKRVRRHVRLHRFATIETIAKRFSVSESDINSILSKETVDNRLVRQLRETKKALARARVEEQAPKKQEDEPIQIDMEDVGEVREEA